MHENHNSTGTQKLTFSLLMTVQNTGHGRTYVFLNYFLPVLSFVTFIFCAFTFGYKSLAAIWRNFLYCDTLSCSMTSNGWWTTRQTGFSTTRNVLVLITTTSTLPHVVVNAWMILSSHEERTESVRHWIDWFSLLEISCDLVCQLWKCRFMKCLCLNLCWSIIAGLPIYVTGETCQWRFLDIFRQRKMKTKSA